ncbi:MAG TPA: hypothetical protein VM452_04440 [Caulifigura sp.]|nr:hypothetical protein [Caulifigura sp.]
MGKKVWAAAANSGFIICPDGSGGEVDPTRADLNWDYGIKFSTLYDLCLKLEGLGEKVARLAICAHGAPGLVDVDSVFPPQSSLTQAITEAQETELFDKCMSKKNFENYRQTLARIGATVEDGGAITFMSCNMASGDPGAEMLKMLSLGPWNKQTVVGFTRIGTIVSKIGINSCRMPGLKFGPDNYSPSMSESQSNKRVEALVKEPWADASSPLAKICRQGVLMKDPDFVDYKKTFIGTWMFEIGTWQKIIVFEGDVGNTMSGACYWADNISAGTKRHPGQWSNIGKNNYLFMFPEKEAPKPEFAKSEFHFDLSQAAPTGRILVGRAEKGQFKLWNTR